MPDGHYEELESDDLISQLIWIDIAFRSAIRDNLDESVLQVMLEWYDEAFEYAVEVDESFRKVVLDTAWKPPQDHQFREKYVEIARRYSES